MKRTIIIIATLLTCLGAAAQNFYSSEYSFYIGGGVSGFRTNPTEGKAFQGGTVTAGIGYHYFFNPQWGIGTGANFAFYNDGISINDYHKQQAAINKETGSPFDFHVSMFGYKEKHRAVMVAIPLMLQYQSEGETAFYAAMGGKVGIPLSAKNSPEGVFTTSGYFPNVNVTYENLPEYGFVHNQPFPGDKTNLKLKTAFLATAEFGVKWLTAEKINVYTGVYADYGLNSTLKSDGVNLVTYQTDAPAIFAYNSAAKAYAKQMKPFAIGIIVRIAVGKQ